MPTFQTDVWISFDEQEVPPDRMEEAITISHELGARETIEYGSLRVKFEDTHIRFAQNKAEAILNRLERTKNA